ncbi:hypothetical protein [Streptomyces sp. NPDC005828]|uniref:hypothetical protein n=1 Tax=Streptomyces sp. NPDC005828 TaxID=3157071 RepID=UPI0033CA61D0
MTAGNGGVTQDRAGPSVRRTVRVAARAVGSVTVQMLAAPVVLDLALEITVGAVRRGRQRRADAHRTRTGGHGR